MTDFNSLKAGILAADQILEEKVEVNQILARYSSDFTVFRELIQNANDAGARSVEIQFIGAQSDELITECTEIVVRNNGRLFQPEDWTRLRRIAEGNPDVDKIGFFGVGFYSLFSVCEEPLILSGDECMTFFWRGDQLFTKKGKSERKDDWTSFYMSLREKQEIPNVDAFCKFLAMSMALTENLGEIKVTANNQLMMHLTKKLSPLSSISALNKLPFVLESPNQIFKLRSAECAHLQLEIRKLMTPSTVDNIVKSIYGIFTRKPQPLKSEYEDLTVFMRYACGQLDVRMPSKFSKEMERTTKKLPPQKTKIQMLYTGLEEYETSVQFCKKHPTFKELVPHPEQGRIFIGFSTHQTTGFPAHVMAHLIPTVERESIDFVDRTLNVWNQEILTMAGLMCRIIYEDVFQDISRLVQQENKDALSGPFKIDSEIVKRSAHMMNVFSFKTSTPTSLVSKLVMQSFLKCLSIPVSCLSTHGVKAANVVRMPDDGISSFSKRIPLIPKLLLRDTGDFCRFLEETGLLMPVSAKDILNELSDRLFTEDETVALLKWWIKSIKENTIDIPEREFYELTLIPGCGIEKRPVALAEVLFYPNQRLIPPTLPLPVNTLPFSLTKAFNVDELENALGLEELDVVGWCRYVSELDDFEKIPFFAEAVLEALSRAYPQQRAADKKAIISMLSKKACVPTTRDPLPLMRPSEAYFKNVTLFGDLPLINFTTKHVADSFLKDLGVRTHVELELVFNRLDSLKWDTVQLMKYLASVQEKLTAVEWERLENAKLFSKEKTKPVVEESKGRTKRVSFSKQEELVTQESFCAHELYTPNDSLRELGMPILEWPHGKWKNNSEEGKFIQRLGLMTRIDLKDLIGLAGSTNDPVIRNKALKYFVDNFDEYKNIYHPLKVITPFLPCEGTSTLSKPEDCYVEEGCRVMGFSVLSKEWQVHAEKFGVRKSPFPSLIVKRLLEEPPAPNDAEAVFCYMGNRSSELSYDHWSQLNDGIFIPIVQERLAQPPELFWTAPSKVFFQTNQNVYEGLFLTVDFKTGNPFLKACGVKDEPNPLECAAEIVTNPAKFLEASGIDRYLMFLRQIAVSLDTIQQTDRELFDEMRVSPFLVAQTEDKLSEEGSFQSKLKAAADIAIVDDTVLRRMFNPFCAPMETLLEEMYARLGSQTLSSLVLETYNPVGDPLVTAESQSLQDLIKERAPLLISEYNQSKKKKSSSKAVERLGTMEVLEVDMINVDRSFKNQKLTQTTTAAFTKLNGNGKEKLFVVGQYDFFDVAQVISRALMGSCKLSDALLISTLLSTSLENLKRKGFPVDRLITKQQEVLQIAPVDAKPAVTDRYSGGNRLKEVSEMFPDCEEAHIKKLLEENNDIEWICNKLLEESYPKKSSLLPQNSKSKSEEKVVAVKSSPEKAPLSKTHTPEGLISNSSSNTRRKSIFERLGFKKSIDDLSLTPSIVSSGSKMNTGKSSGPVESHQLRSELLRAAHSCGPNRSQRFKTSQQNIDVILDKACDIIPAQDLVKHTDIRLEFRKSFTEKTVITLPFYVSKSIARETADFISVGPESQTHPLALRAFASILLHLAELFDIKSSAIHVYVDGDSVPGQTIAFNSGGSLFFNFRYFLEFHMSCLRRFGIESGKALSLSDNRLQELHGKDLIEISKLAQQPFYYWYLVYCHELAHQFVTPHDAKHEFFFSSFAENYMPQLMFTLLNAADSSALVDSPPANTKAQ